MTFTVIQRGASSFLLLVAKVTSDDAQEEEEEEEEEEKENERGAQVFTSSPLWADFWQGMGRIF